MRVISGLFKGRKLEPIKIRGIRPTSDRVKEALFSILSNDIEGSIFLDLFAGSGSIGIEAYSRGASKVIFVDSNVESFKVLQQNLNKLSLKEDIELHNADYKMAIKKLGLRGEKFDIIFIDPPYGENLSIDAINEINKNDIIDENGLIVVEHSVKEPMPKSINIYELHKRKVYGNTQLSFYVFNTSIRR